MNDIIGFYSQHVNGLRLRSGDEWQGHCPYPERHDDGCDSHPSWSVNAITGQFYCHACEVSGNLITFCKDKSIAMPDISNNQKNEPEAFFNYRDEHENLHFQVVRLPGKNFYQRRPDKKDRWINEVKGIPKIPYLLPELLRSNIDEWVFIVEGEKHVDRLYELSLTATCNVGGALKWTKDLNPHFKNRKIAILPDNDKPGKKHAIKVAENLFSFAKEIRIVELPGLKHKGDILDWLAEGNTKDELLNLVDKTKSWEPNDSHIKEENIKSQNDRNNSIESKLLDLFENDPGIILFRDEKEVGFIKISNLIIPIKSRRFNNYLKKLIWETEEKSCCSDKIRSIQGLIEAKAIYDNPKYDLFVRIAKKDNKFFFDLGGGKVACFEKGMQWQILENPPILFRSFSHQKEHILPKPPGDLKRILRYINFKRPKELPEDKLSKNELLYLCYLVFCLVPGLPQPIIILAGDQGSGKTTLFKITKPLIDPSHVNTISNPSDYKEFIQIAHHHYLLFLDNLSNLSSWLSDALCRCSTGEGFSKRELFTDDEDIFYSFQRCIGFNGINMVASKADILDRSIIFSFERISDEKRIDENEFYQAYNEDLPHILYGLFDAFSKALEYIDDIKLSRKPRMADFAKWGCAIAMALGFTKDDFINAYNQNIKLQHEEALDASPIAEVIISFMEEKYSFEASSTELLSELEQVAEALKIKTNSKNWPKDPRWLWRRIKEVRPNLSAIGIQAEHDRNSKSKKIILKNIRNDGTNGTDGITIEKQSDKNANIDANRIKTENDVIGVGTQKPLINKTNANTADNANIFCLKGAEFKTDQNGLIDEEI